MTRITVLDDIRKKLIQYEVEFLTRYAEASSAYALKNKCDPFEIVKRFETENIELYGVKLIKSVKTENGFINFSFTEEFYTALANKIIDDTEKPMATDHIIAQGAITLEEYALARSIMYARKEHMEILDDDNIKRTLLMFVILACGEGNEKIRREAFINAIQPLDHIEPKNRQEIFDKLGLVYECITRLILMIRQKGFIE